MTAEEPIYPFDKLPPDPISTKRYTVEQIKAACPACDGKGGTCSTRYAHACGGDDQRCAVMCPVPEEDWEQCEYCGRLLAALDESDVSRG